MRPRVDRRRAAFEFDPANARFASPVPSRTERVKPHGWCVSHLTRTSNVFDGKTAGQNTESNVLDVALSVPVLLKPAFQVRTSSPWMIVCNFLDQDPLAHRPIAERFLFGCLLSVELDARAFRWNNNLLAYLRP